MIQKDRNLKYTANQSLLEEKNDTSNSQEQNKRKIFNSFSDFLVGLVLPVAIMYSLLYIGYHTHLGILQKMDKTKENKHYGLKTNSNLDNLKDIQRFNR